MKFSATLIAAAGSETLNTRGSEFSQECFHREQDYRLL